MGFCIIKYQEGFIIYPGHGGKHTVILNCHRLLNHRSHSQPVSAVVSSSQKGYFALVFVSFGDVVTRNVRLSLLNLDRGDLSAALGSPISKVRAIFQRAPIVRSSLY